MTSSQIVVSQTWRDLDLDSLQGVLLVVGAPDTGKSTFARWLFEQLRARRAEPLGWLDCDVGQNSLGAPTMLSLALAPSPGAPLDLTHWFVGDVSPRGRMLPLVVGAGRLVGRGLAAGARVLVVNTTGLIDPAYGGVALKHALVDQLQPTAVLAFQRWGELEPILVPLRCLAGLRLVELPVSEAVRRRDVPARQANRAQAFQHYFEGAEVLRLPLRHLALFDGGVLAPGRLLALQDAAGFALALGVVVRHSQGEETLSVRTPLKDPGPVVSLRLGAIGLDAATGQEFRPGRRR